MKTMITLSLLVFFATSQAMADSSKQAVMAKGEVETDCPWSKQDERNEDTSLKLKASNEVKEIKKKTVVQ